MLGRGEEKKPNSKPGFNIDWSFSIHQCNNEMKDKIRVCETNAVDNMLTALE